jgi:hypothetical protein
MVTPPSLARGHPFFAPVRGYCGQFKRGLCPGAVTIAAHEANGALIGYERNGPDDEDKAMTAPLADRFEPVLGADARRPMAGPT